MAASGSGGTPALAGRPFLFLLPYPSLSGLELFGLRFARDLLDRGLPAAIASPPGGLIAEQAARRQIPWVALPELWRWDPWAVARLAGFLREGKPRAVVAFRTQAIYPLHLARLLTRSPTPFLLFYRLGAGNQPRRDPLHRVLFRHLAAVVPNADHVRQKILAKWAIDPAKVVCIKSGIDIHRYRPDPARRAAFRQAAGLPAAAFVVGNAGRIHPEKGSGILLEALFGPGGPGRARPDVHLVYVGREYRPGYGDELRARAAALGVAERFHLLPFRDDVEAVYPGFDLFALAVTAVETYAYVTLEAMACGVVPVVPSTGGMKEMFTHGREGFFFRHREAEDLRRVLAEAIALPTAAREAMAAAARARIEATAAWPTMMEAYLALFRRLGIPLMA
ncbi:MAG: Glycosyltransferase [Candidatus Ozemobacter sibiricus]|jgi:glycosyltransferase involved in cell wall biosynthesis|uniref:Glycosyltransferase n=1 Tax=Candidatus Ozemobacter sibiricus TaxID=2268124 RepID=A0A367ZLK7_9BACT|nr:MAG: Glycosyltransferase [Candidatus Ozemobacter sibiricus]